MSTQRSLGTPRPIESVVDIAIGGKAPEMHCADLAYPCGGSTTKSGLTTLEDLRSSLCTNCRPHSLHQDEGPLSDDFLWFMARKGRDWFQVLG